MGVIIIILGKPDMLRLYTKSDFTFNGTAAKNSRLKWLAICLNFNYVNGTVDMFLNGEKSQQKVKKPITLPADSDNKPLIIRIGHYYFDDTPLIGKMVDINAWDRYHISPKKFHFIFYHENIINFGHPGGYQK